MSHHSASVTQTFPLRSYFDTKSIDRSAIVARIITLGHVAAVLLLAALIIRVIGSLFLLNDPVFHAIMALTGPLVKPFNNLIPSASAMIQVGSMLAYCVYCTAYFILRASIGNTAYTRKRAI